MKKKLSLLFAAAMCVLLAGCGKGSGPSDASDVVSKYNELVKDSVNYHAEMAMDISISAKADGLSMDLPVGFTISADVLDGNIHGNIGMSTAFMGMEMDETMEVYVESGKGGSTMYSYNSDDGYYGYWTVSEDTENAEAVLGFVNLDPDDFKDAVMEYDKNKGIYTVIQGFKDFMGSSPIYGLVDGLYSGMAEMVSIDTDNVADGWSSAKVIYVFDKDCYLTSVTVDGCEYSGSIEEDGVNAEVSVTLGLSFKFSEYGKIKASDVEVPEDVSGSAVPSVTINIDGPSWDAGYDDDEGYTFDDSTEGPDVNPVEGDMLGSYNGIPFTGMGDPWDGTFGADGWEFDNEDGEYSFMSAVNPKYGDSYLYVYNAGRNETTKSDILDGGIYGYDIECQPGSAYPAMTFNGLTFGAGAEDVLDAYGEPDYVYEGSMYTIYEYDFSSDLGIELYVYPDSGMQRVSVSYWGEF